MSATEAIYEVIHVKNCPYYNSKDEFIVSGNALLLEHNKGNKFISTAIIDLPRHRRECKTLVTDLTKILIEYEQADRIPEQVISCSQCKGIIKLEHKKGTSIAIAEDIVQYSADANSIASLLHDFSIFKTLNQSELQELVSLLRMRKYIPDVEIMRQGDPGKHLFIILSGLVDVLDQNGNSIARLSNGEVFGEMSLISGKPVVATIKVLNPTSVLYIRGQDFLQILNRFPSLQMYFARLLASRLSKSNAMISNEFFPGMRGALDQMTPAELFQTLNFNKKTGTLNLDLSKGRAILIFCDGRIVWADYDKKFGKDAFLATLDEKSGRFNFKPGISEQEMALPEIGMFMEMLIEGLRDIGEVENEQVAYQS